jgi:neutral ceramidase
MIHKFKAGAAKIDITPPLGTLINGDFVPHYARYIHDPLHAKALVMQKGDTTVAFVVVDICSIKKELIDLIKIEINKQTGITKSNILISATHTHAAGSVTDSLLTPVDFAYRQKISVLIADAVSQAIQNLQPAKVGFGSVNAPEHVICRRYFMKEGYTSINPVTGNADIIKTNPFNGEEFIERPENKLDPEVCYVAVQDLDGKWIGVLANYSVHYVGDWENGTISADYFGVFANKLQQKLNADDGFIGIMSNGTSGESNTWDFLHPNRYPAAFFAKSELIGNELAEKVLQSLNNIQWNADPTLSSQYEEVEVGVRKPSADELNAAKKLVADTDYGNIQNVDADTLKRIYAREQVLLNEFPDVVLFPVQAIKIGNCIIGGLGGEIFAETGLSIKQSKGEINYFTISLANGNAGYVPPSQEFELGGYETWRCRTSQLEVNAENKIRNTLKKLVETLSH